MMSGFDSAHRDALIALRSRVDLREAHLMMDGTPFSIPSPVTSFPFQRSDEEKREAVAELLYTYFYAGFSTPSAEGSLVEALSAANDSEMRWDAGWSVVEKDRTNALLEKATTIRLAGPRQYRIAEDGRAALRVASEADDAQDSYYFAFGETVADQIDLAIESRFYLAVAHRDAPSWMAALTRSLNAYAIPFAIKMLNRRELYGRPDSAVIYVARRYASVVASLLRRLAESMGGLAPREPLFTNRIAPGVAYADSPPDGTSFGVVRMRLLASALIGHVRNGRSPDRFVEDAEYGFRAAGLDPAAPYLNPGNSPLTACGASVAPVRARENDPRVAAGLACARKLVRDAIWADGRCCWQNWSDPRPDRRSNFAVETSEWTLGYGSAGIALFLGHAARLADDQGMRDTALAAIRHAADHALGRPPSIGAYDGTAGVYFAAATLGALLRDDETMGLAASLHAHIRSFADDAPPDDIYSGHAGLIRVLLLASGGALSDESLSLAEATTQRIVEKVQRDKRGAFVPNAIAAPGSILTGYSHGQSGIAAALTAYGLARKDRTILHLASELFATEVGQFDAALNNWPDNRQSAQLGTGDEARRAPMTAWCNGSAGIVLSLARHAPDLVDRRGESACNEILDWVARYSRREEVSHNLCHGIVGNLAILHEIARLQNRPQLEAKVRDLAIQLIAQRRHNIWASGNDLEREDPGLLVGLAGVGQAFLYMAGVGVPTPLLL